MLRHELVNKAFLEHKTTKECVEKIKKIINELLHDNGFKSLTQEDSGELNLGISKEAKVPKFDDWDWFIGLDITIHDTYSTKIYLDDFEIIETETRG